MSFPVLSVRTTFPAKFGSPTLQIQSEKTMSVKSKMFPRCLKSSIYCSSTLTDVDFTVLYGSQKVIFYMSVLPLLVRSRKTSTTYRIARRIDRYMARITYIYLVPGIYFAIGSFNPCEITPRQVRLIMIIFREHHSHVLVSAPIRTLCSCDHVNICSAENCNVFRFIRSMVDVYGFSWNHRAMLDPFLLHYCGGVTI